MASVAFEFSPPDQEGMVALRVFEATSESGPFFQIDETTEIGTFPEYVHHFTTDAAASPGNWFALQWADSGGAVTDLSPPFRGGIETLVSRVTDRVRQRDSSLEYAAVRQEAEAAIERQFGTDPYSDEILDVTYRVLNGLVYLVLANCYILARAASSDSESVSIGLVSLRSSTTSASKSIDELLNLANSALGLNTSIVLQMADLKRRHRHLELLEA